MVHDLITFAEKTKALDATDKLKLILFAAGVKPATYIRLKINKNLHDKHKFEDLLKKHGSFFLASKAKGYEEIQKIEGNAVKWHYNGLWYGYDLFHTTEKFQQFQQYKRLLREQKHTQADKVAGNLYDYPESAVKAFIEHHNKKTLAKKYTYYQYYKRLHEIDRAFPFITHLPASPKNPESKKQNELYKKTVKKHAPGFYKEYTKKRTYKVPVIVDVESTVPGIWKQRKAHDYVVITSKPVEGKYWLISWLTRKNYKRGTILDAKVTMQYDYATIDAKKELGRLTNLHHERHFTKL